MSVSVEHLFFTFEKLNRRKRIKKHDTHIPRRILGGSRPIVRATAVYLPMFSILLIDYAHFRFKATTALLVVALRGSTPWRDGHSSSVDPALGFQVAGHHLLRPIHVCFSFLFAGYNRMLRVFDVSQPGRSFEARPTCKTRKSKTGQRGIISALAFCPETCGGGLFAAGSYGKTICLYSENRWAHRSVSCR